MSSQVFNVEHLSSVSGALLPKQVAVLQRAMAALPPLPFHLQELHEQLRALPMDLDEITRLVASQRVLHWHVLTISHAGVPGQPLNLEHSVLLLGAERLRTLAIASSLIAMKIPGQAPNVAGRIAQASLRAMLSQKIANDMDYPDAEMAYIAGLLRELGSNGSRLHAGKDDASEMAAWMAALWNLPGHVVGMIRNFERQDAESDNPLSQIVRRADVVCEAWIGENNAGIASCSETGLQQALRANFVRLTDAQCHFMAVDMWTRLSALLSCLNDVN